MLRTEALEDITDGKKYGVNDMVKVGTGGCMGCSKCCETMADTIVLSPYDVWRLGQGTGLDFEGMLDRVIELKVHDGIVLPNMKSVKGCCVMLNEGRCKIHSNRPDFCRLFPLGRMYEGDSFSYVMQINQCDKASVKVKVKKWIDTSDYEEYSQYILRWHSLLRATELKAAEPSEDSEGVKKMLTSLLALFYQQSYCEEDFYGEFEKRAMAYCKAFL